MNSFNAGTLEDQGYYKSFQLIRDLEELDILTEITHGKRSRFYRFEEYLDLYR